MTKNYSGLLEGEEFNAEKPFVSVGWPDRRPINTFNSREDLWHYLDREADQDSAVSLGRAFEFQEGRWIPVKLPKKKERPVPFRPTKESFQNEKTENLRRLAESETASLKLKKVPASSPSSMVNAASSEVILHNSNVSRGTHPAVC